MKLILEKLRVLEPTQKKWLAVLAACMLLTDLAFLTGHILLIVAAMAGVVLSGAALCRCRRSRQT